MSLPAELDGQVFEPAVPRPSERPINILALLYRFWRNPLEIWSRAVFREPRCTFGLLGKSAILLNDPDDIYACFVKNGHHLVHAEFRQKVAQPLLQQGVLVAEGETWRTGRRMVGHALSAEQTATSADRIHAALRDGDLLAIGDGTEIRLADFMDRLTMRLLSEVMFSGDLDDSIDDVLKMAEAYFESFGRVGPLDLFRFPSWIPRMSRVLGQKHRREFRALVRGIVDRRITRPPSSGTRDAFDMLIADARDAGAPRELVEDNVLTLMITGHETVSLALTWTIFLLSRSPAALARVRGEIDGADLSATDPMVWGRRLPYLLACFKEAMRMYPPGPIIAREIVEDVVLDGGTLARGNVVFLNTWILHRHAALWQHPNAFMPERFLPENKAAIRPYSYLPFGVGHRACLGAQYATIEAVIVLAMLLRTYDFAYVGGRDPKPMLKVTISADNGVPVRVTRRR